MSILNNGLRAIEQGECPWRITLNNNIEGLYSKGEADTIVTGKSDILHIHPGYFPVRNLVSQDDIRPVLSNVMSDIAFSDTYGPCLVDRTTAELMRLVIVSGVISAQGTGEYAALSNNKIIATPVNISAIYSDVTNGEVT